MDAVHIPPWDSDSGFYEEYPTTALSKPSKADKGAAKCEKAQRKEQQRLQAMINGIVRLSPLPAARAAGASVVDAGHAQSQSKDRKTAAPGQAAARPTSIAAKDQATPSTGGLGERAKRRVAELSDPLAAAGIARVPRGTVSVASQEINSHKAGRQKRQKTSGGDDLGTRGNVQSAKRERGAGAVADILLAAAAGQGSQPGVSAANQERKDRMHDIKHEQGRPPEAEQDKLRKKRNRNKFKQTDEGGDAADLYKLHLQQQSPLDKSKQGLQYLHEQEQQAKPEQDALNKKRNRNISRQRDEAGQAAAYQSSQARSSVQQALQQPSSSAKVPEVPELDHRLSSKKQAAQKKQSIWEADAQGNEMGVNIGKGARKQNGQHTAGKQTATPNSLKGALLAGKHAVTQDGQLGRRHAATGSLHAAGPSRPKQDSLLSKMRAKLSGSQFRWLNEQLYTCPGSQAFELMQEQPQLFTQYHEGFKQQTAKWPLQPIQAAASYLHRQSKAAVVADFGCGDADLVRMVPQQTVHSLDLVSSAPGVIACNMAHTPLGTGSVDVAVFCLALMGTDYPSFLVEAARVLKPHGIIWIAEVRSRFVPEGGDAEDFAPFLRAMKGMGFAKKALDCSNSHFVTFEMHRQGKSIKDAENQAWPLLRACTYKKR